MEKMFFAHACGRELRLPLFDCDWKIAMSFYQMMSSICCEIEL